jgi:tetratricopeptide (TPR) repeat protein
MKILEKILPRNFAQRSSAIRRIVIILTVVGIFSGLQAFIHLVRLAPLMEQANQTFLLLLDERQNHDMTVKVIDSVSNLRTFSDDNDWQKELDELQSELQQFINSPSNDLEVIITRVSVLKDKHEIANELVEKLIDDLTQLDEWHHDYYGDILARIISPGIGYWPTSILLKYYYSGSLVDTVQFNRALYLVIVGEVSSGQATLGQLRTNLPDSELRARVLYTQGRLLYGMGRYEQSLEIVQDSISMDPEHGLGKRFLEYQISHGPDEEVEEEDESIQPVGAASSGGATLF